MARRALVVDWNGKDLPSALRDLPAGRYVVEAVDDDAFSDEEDRGIEHALAQYRQGHTADAAHVRQRLDSLLKL